MNNDKIKDKSKIKVLIGLSGGVDSAVAAYLLKKEGYDVTGCFMRNWDSIANNDIKGNPNLNLSKCTQEFDYDDAIKSAKEIGIQLKRVDFIKEYWEYVFTYFLETYKQGYTPNPDVFCNKYIKFESFRKYAKDNGFDYIAMGHYAKRIVKNNESFLYKASDLNKDQSYFLCQISQEQLSSCLFPLADIDKPTVRKIAEELNLSVAKKRDSTGVCFIGERHFKEFLENYLPSKEGNIVDIVNNKVIGKHEGVLYYTVGQRKGLNIGGGVKGYTMDPFFVVGKNVKTNTLYVCQEANNNYRFSSKCLLTNLNLINKNATQKKFDCNCKFRYRGKDMKVEVELLENNKAYLYYDNYEYITKGQIACLYIDDWCLGGGIISKIYDDKGKEITI